MHRTPLLFALLAALAPHTALAQCCTGGVSPTCSDGGTIINGPPKSCSAGTMSCQPLRGTACTAGGGGGGGSQVTCPTDTAGAAYAGTAAYVGKGPMAAPARGNVGCVDLGPLATRPTGNVGGTNQDLVNIYGSMEAGFTSAQPGASCLGTNELPGGVDTNLAEAVMVSVIAWCVIVDMVCADLANVVMARMRVHVKCVRARMCVCGCG